MWPAVVVDLATVPPMPEHAAFLEAARAAMAAERAAEGFPAADVEHAARLAARMSAGAAPAALRTHTAAIAAAGAIDLDVPTASNLPGGSQVKLGLKRAMDWYLRHVVAQIGDLVLAVSRFGVAAVGELERVDTELSHVRDELQTLRRELEELQANRRR